MLPTLLTSRTSPSLSPLTLKSLTLLTLKSLTSLTLLSLTSLTLLSLTSLTLAGESRAAAGEHHQYVVVGAGPAGLQLGHFLQRAGRDYVIVERGNSSGEFFRSYPRHGTLISINKRHTGQRNGEFNLRHDWNSLLSDDPALRFTEYSKLLFPPREKMLEYLQDFQVKLGLNVRHNTEVSGIRKLPDGKFRMQNQFGVELTCDTLVLATGMSKPYIPEILEPYQSLVEGYEDVSTNAEDFEGQSVLIIGHGNSAFEVANAVYGSTNLVHMMGRSRIRLSWETHYVGDLRAVNNALLDTYQLKSLDGVFETGKSNELVVERQSDGKLHLDAMVSGQRISEIYDNFAIRSGYDRVIRCTGFKFDCALFDTQQDNSSTTMCTAGGDTRRGKYPKIQANYESTTTDGLFFVGTNTHSLDLRKSAGGFIHGFRYTTKALFHLLEARNHRVAWPSVRIPSDQLLLWVVKRINEASDIYQMFSVLGDVIVFDGDGDGVRIFEGFPIRLLGQFQQHTLAENVSSVLVLVMQYGKDFSGPGKDVFRDSRATGEPSRAHQSNFLHPVIYFYKNVPTEQEMKDLQNILPRPDLLHHFVEDFMTEWTAAQSHILPLRRFLEHVMRREGRQFFNSQCLKMAMTHVRVPHFCQHYLQPTGSGAISSPL